MTTKKKKVGRPALAKKEAKRNILTLRLKDEEVKEIQIIAERSGLTMSEWIRKALRKQLDDDSRST